MAYPPHIIKALGCFDLDPCSPVNRPWDTAGIHYTIEDDGLLVPWEGRVWCNPPYGTQTEEWLMKCAMQGNAVALTFAWKQLKNTLTNKGSLTSPTLKFSNLSILLYTCTMKDVKNIERVRKWQQEQKSKGLCIECSNPANGLRCDKCNRRRSKKKKENYVLWKNLGKCYKCGENTLTGKAKCLPCTLRNISAKSLGKQKYWKSLITLMENQNFKCGLTGDNISFESEIELDHIQPKSRGGGDELSNLRWVLKEANRLKQDKTDVELKELCKKILLTLNKLDTP